jgi:acyl-coenzyme A thioesterase PaaI-like protein
MTRKSISPPVEANHCFVCGPENPIGLKIIFQLTEKGCIGEYTPLKEHSGFNGVTHGGIVFAILDDVMANWFYLQGGSGYTAKSEIRYREPMPIGVAVKLECEIVKEKGRLVQLQSRASNKQTNTVYAEADASFILNKKLLKS